MNDSTPNERAEPRLADGLLLIDKPIGISSFDIIRKLRRATGVKKIGHAGTLDPAATGLMLMLFGKACKQAERFSKLDKTYEAELTLGLTSTTDDQEGELSVHDVATPPTTEQIAAAIESFTGEITQVPSAYSAIKIDGKEAYKRVRAGESVTMPERRVVIRELELITYDFPRLVVRADVSSGTYIRTLARDLGEALGSGAYLSALRRTSVGEWGIDRAHKLNEITPQNLDERLVEVPLGH